MRFSVLGLRSDIRIELQAPVKLHAASPTPMILQTKFDFNRPAGLRDIHVWKCERKDARTDAGSNPILKALPEPSAHLS